MKQSRLDQFKYIQDKYSNRLLEKNRMKSLWEENRVLDGFGYGSAGL